MESQSRDFMRLSQELNRGMPAKGYVFDENIELPLDESLKSIKLSECTFNSNLLLNPHSKVDVTLENCKISGVLEITTYVDLGKINIIKTKINAIDFQNNDKYPELTIEDGSEVQSLIHDGKVKVVSSYLNKAQIFGGNITVKHFSTLGHLQIYEGEVEIFDLEACETLEIGSGDITLTISNSKLDWIWLHETENLEGFIENTSIRNIQFNNFFNKGNLTLSNIDIKLITINNANLKGVKIYNCDFTIVLFTVFLMAKIKDIEYASVKWPSKPFVKNMFPVSPGSPQSNLKKNQLDFREFYRQLKIAAINQHDKINQLNFYALEMNAFSASLKWNLSSMPDKISLAISRITNNYGQNWWWPIFWYIGITWGFFLVFYLIDTCFHLTELTKMFNSLDFGILLNPTHGIDKFEVIQPQTSGRVIADFILRIIQATLIYQTIVAFRKFFR